MLTHETPAVLELADQSADGPSTPEEIVAWTLRRFEGRNLVLTTSFGMEGCALIDMVARHGVTVPVVYLDTMFLFPETYALRDRMAARYPHLRFENRGTTLTPQAQADRFGPELWRRDPDRCCALRKVEPMRQALAGVEVWLTGLMRSQGGARSALRELQWNESYELVQVNPLAGWDRRRVWDYVVTHEVPYNELHERGYPTLGCTHCTVAVAGVGAGDYTRAGRWAGSPKTECGLHFDSPRHLAREA
ncbi:MAG TPA: phosphoadenylyl-sulfate reductase [Gemmatimonadales bacterium]|nr:phosphoadenylyl-sulfate reductase [Gemmatimonadales bacterium]